MADGSMEDLMLEAAHRDADVYFALVDNASIHDSVLGFHAQQAVEKAPKAVMFKRRLEVPRTHNLAVLLDMLSDAETPAPPHADLLDTLNPFAVGARYGPLDAGALDRPTVGVWLAEVLAWAAATPGS